MDNVRYMLQDNCVVDLCTLWPDGIKMHWCKGLFINDVIIFGGYADPPSPLPLVITRHFLRVTHDKANFATKQRMLGS